MSENNCITLKNISKSFSGHPIISSLSCTLSAGKIYCIRGKNGSGKTTLFRMILGLTPPDSGEISVSGDIAVAFQEHRLFYHLSALKNASIGCGDLNEAKRLLAYFGFNEKDIKKKPKALSGGMKQIVSIVRALSCGRKILLLDEASKELDANARASLRRLLSELKSDMLIVMITHDEDDLKIADEIIDI